MWKGSQFPTVLSGLLGEVASWEAAWGGVQPAVFPKVPAPQQGCWPPTNILCFLQSKITSANPLAGGMFTQIRHPWLCPSLATLHHNTVSCLAQKKKCGSSQKAMRWQRKNSGISDVTNWISNAQPLNLRTETSVRYMHPTPNLPGILLLPAHLALVISSYIVPAPHPWLYVMPGTACGWDRTQPWGAPTTHGGSRHLGWQRLVSCLCKSDWKEWGFFCFVLFCFEDCKFVS